MSEETVVEKVEETTETKTHEESVPYERFQQTSRQAREAKESAKAAEKRIADLQSQLEEREAAGLPELEQMKKRLEQAEKRAEENERKATEAETLVSRSRKQGWVTQAAQAQNFADPSDASAFLDLDDIEDEKDAERHVKRLAGQKKHLLKAEEPKLPGRVLQDGQAVTAQKRPGFDPMADAEMLAEGLRKFASKT